MDYRVIYFSLLYFYLASVAIAAISSMKSFRLKNALHLQIFAGLLGLALAVEITSLIVLPKLGLKRFVDLTYNGFFLLEFEVYCLFFYFISKGRRMKVALTIGAFVLPALWISMLVKGASLYQWNSISIVIGGFIVVCFSLALLFSMLFGDEPQSPLQRPEFWIIMGLILYYSCAIPFFGMLNTLVKDHLILTQRLLLVNIAIDALMYLLFARGYLCKTLRS